ncbi:hypothetical protein DVH24_015133 [Malus domestica]|uniref:Uncharacterized protein n=1 Tax=Malus domestica TaxID=3750 RepID=A0A498K684_MALDO|nr:hypothetical protein DVH24_015133 [Malus domestica]
MRHLSTVGFSAIEAKSFKALKLEPRVLISVFLCVNNLALTMNSDEFEVHLFPKPAAVRLALTMNSDEFEVHLFPKPAAVRLEPFIQALTLAIPCACMSGSDDELRRVRRCVYVQGA